MYKGKTIGMDLNQNVLKVERGSAGCLETMVNSKHCQLYVSCTKHYFNLIVIPKLYLHDHWFQYLTNDFDRLGYISKNIYVIPPDAEYTSLLS